ncbi:hypothetical protein K490DRAFT_53159 [Saccharata proteae CBS 121410]|uniref:Uncharacterized protein n=1 Tax=Saccharata proteae CBS 121410 TaxID=1314787 RepID=A0A9P4I3W5_9PEZI|nr:hypothetical protein K490DRAFT_53159 [Saccharata proteae CBS 121410]
MASGNSRKPLLELQKDGESLPSSHLRFGGKILSACAGGLITRPHGTTWTLACSMELQYAPDGDPAAGTVIGLLLLHPPNGQVSANSGPEGDMPAKLLANMIYLESEGSDLTTVDHGSFLGQLGTRCHAQKSFCFFPSSHVRTLDQPLACEVTQASVGLLAERSSDMIRLYAGGDIPGKDQSSASSSHDDSNLMTASGRIEQHSEEFQTLQTAYVEVLTMASSNPPWSAMSASSIFTDHVATCSLPASLVAAWKTVQADSAARGAIHHFVRPTLPEKSSIKTEAIVAFRSSGSRALIL